MRGGGIRHRLIFAAIAFFVICGTFAYARLTLPRLPQIDQAAAPVLPNEAAVTAATAITPSPLLPTPTVQATWTAGDKSLAVFIVPIADSEYADHARTYAMGVRRGDQLYSLQSTDDPEGFGCQVQGESPSTFGCYFGSGWFQTLDADAEPEIIAAWEHGGSGGYASLHVYRWDGSSYPLIGIFFERGLRWEIADLNGDGVKEIMLNYQVGPHQLSFPWVDIYTFSGSTLVNASNHYPEFYQHLLERYADIGLHLSPSSVEAAELDQWVAKAEQLANSTD